VQLNAPTGMKDGLLDFKGLVLPAVATVDGFEFRVKNAAGHSNPALVTLTDLPLVLDNEKNEAAAQAQKITTPCTLCGFIENESDQDWYSFSAKKGQVFTIEGFGDRLNVPVNFYIQLRKVDGKDNPVVATFDSHPDLPPPNQGFSYGSDDPKGKFTVPDDGEYLLNVTSLTALSRNGPRFVYRINIRPERPDFRLMLVENETDNAGSFTVHKGGCQELAVYLIREDGFDGEVLLEAEGLPAGVTCLPQVVGPKLKKGVLVIQAAENAAEFSGPIKIKGTAVIDGKPVVRPAQAACLVWPAPNQIPAISRITKSICMAVRDKGVFVLETEVKELMVPVGGTLDVKVKVKRFASDFKAQVQVVRLSSPALTNGQLINVPNVNIDGNKSEVVVKITIPNNTQPGTYSLVFQGKAKYNAEDPKDSKKKKNTDVYEASPPVKVIVYDQLAEIAIPNPKLTVQAGNNVELPIKLKRLFDYKGEYEVTVTVPGGVAGVTVDKLKIPANGTEGKLVIKTAKNATVTTNPNFQVKVSGKVGNLTFNTEAKFELGITKAAAALVPAGQGTLVQAQEAHRLLPTLLYQLPTWLTNPEN
jgi:hypothetical protein